jgi:hypothetical protein
MHHHANSDGIVLDTIGKLEKHGHGLFGWCCDCAATYRKDLLPLIERPALFDIDLSALIAARGANSAIPGQRSIRCPRCGSRETEIRVTTPAKGD